MSEVKQLMERIENIEKMITILSAGVREGLIWSFLNRGMEVRQACGNNNGMLKKWENRVNEINKKYIDESRGFFDE